MTPFLVLYKMNKVIKAFCSLLIVTLIVGGFVGLVWFMDNYTIVLIILCFILLVIYTAMFIYDVL